MRMPRTSRRLSSPALLKNNFSTTTIPRKRTYLRARLDAFLAREHQAAGRIKRGGEGHIVSLDFETAEGELRQHDVVSGELRPEEYFHREWVRNLFAMAFDDLKRACDPRGKQIAYRL